MLGPTALQTPRDELCFLRYGREQGQDKCLPVGSQADPHC